MNSEQMRNVAEKALHHLTTLHGLYAVDEDPSVTRNECEEDGIDNHSILDGIVERTWRIDESSLIEEIRAALDAEATR